MEQGTRVRHPDAELASPDPGTPAGERPEGHTWRQRWEDRHLYDRWRWRRRIRADPRAYRLYRWAVGVVGTLLVLTGVSTGWLPGPGGIPLTLLGLAVLASEFRWAHRVFGWASRRSHELMTWTRGLPAVVRWLSATGLFLGVLAAMTWSGAIFLGLPTWLPDPVATTLQMLPGVD